ncbi:MAG TPA: hypothetical protein VFH15_13320 [Pyrinomonadaceae bacterium]|nr:hypothetical protein [Pyrinomonadaceae bacterium]
MILAKTKIRLTILLGLVAFASMNTTIARAQTSPPLPNPVLVFLGSEYYQASGKSFLRYRFEVHNREAYPDSLFAAAPALPPCGSNTNASRTWIDFYDMRGKRLYGFCALRSHKDLLGIWFALEVDVVPPSWVYIEMTDRQTGTKYKSNLSDTTM